MTSVPLLLDPNYHQPRHTYNHHHHPHNMPLRPRHKKPRFGSPNQQSKRDTTSQDPNHNSYISNATIMDRCNRSGSDPMITEYTAKDASAFATLDINANNRRSQGNHQSTNMNDNNTVEAGHDTKLLYTHF